MAIPKEQPAPIDPAVKLVQSMAGLRTAKAVWERIWSKIGGRPGTLTIHLEEIGKWVGAAAPRRSGEHLLGSLERARLIQGSGPGGAIAKKKGWWTFDVVDPSEAIDGFRRIDGDPQGELPFPEEQKPALAPVGVLSIRGEEQEEHPNTPNTPHGASAGASAENRLDDPAYLRTVDGLAELWVATLQSYTGNARKRDRHKAVKLMVQATLDAGFPADEIAAAIRDRANKLEFYGDLHGRLLRAKKGKQNGKGTSHGDYDATRSDFPVYSPSAAKPDNDVG
jgi:hypothetical protein